MAVIVGLDKLYFSDITINPNTGYETYGSPYACPGVQNVDISVDIEKVKTYRDDGTWEEESDFHGGTISLKIAEIGMTTARKLTGGSLDNNGVLVYSREDASNLVAVGYRALNSDGSYDHIWLYRVLFSAPDRSFETQGSSFVYQSPVIEGDIMPRVKPDSRSKHPWRAYAASGVASSSVLSNWFSSVYEASY